MSEGIKYDIGFDPTGEKTSNNHSLTHLRAGVTERIHTISQRIISPTNSETQEENSGVQAIDAIKAEFGGFAEAIGTQDAIKQEVNQLFLDSCIKPLLIKAADERIISPATQKEYLQLYAEGLNQGIVVGDEERNAIEQRQQRMRKNIAEMGYPNNQSLNKLLDTYGWYGTPTEAISNDLLAILIAQQQNQTLRQISREVEESSLEIGEKEAVKTALDEAIVSSDVSDMCTTETGVDLWKAMQESTAVQQLFTEEERTAANDDLAHTTIQRLLALPVNDQQRVDLGKTLMRFKTAEAAPFVIINAWREAGYRDNWTNVNDIDINTASGQSLQEHPAIYDYVASLPAEVLEQLRTENIPGIIDAITLIKDNPTNFYTEHDLSQRRISRMGAPKNPIYVDLMQNLGTAAIHLVEQGGEQQAFAADLLQSARISFEDQDYGKVLSVLKSELDADVREKLLNSIIYKEGPHGVKKLFREYPNLHHSVQEEIKEKSGSYFRSMLLYQTKDPEIMQGFATLWDTQPEHIVETIDFLTQLPEVQYLPPFDQDKPLDFLELARDPAVRERVLALTESGYTFSIDHVSLLQAITHEDSTSEVTGQQVHTLLASLDGGYNTDAVSSYISVLKNPDQLNVIGDLYQYGYRFHPDHLAALPYIVENSAAIKESITEIRSLIPRYKYTIVIEDVGDESEKIYETDPYEVFAANTKDYLHTLHKNKTIPEASRLKFYDGILKHLWQKEVAFEPSRIPTAQYELFRKGIESVIAHTGTITPSEDQDLGALFLQMKAEDASELLLDISERHYYDAGKEMDDIDDTFQITEDNWQEVLYMYTKALHGNEQNINPHNATKVKELFQDQHIKDFCLEQVRQQYQSFINGDDEDALPFSLQTLSEYSQKYGLGPLTQLESTLNFVQSLSSSVIKNPDIPQETTTAILNGLRETEAKFVTQRWSNDARTNFYNTSQDILSVDPALFSEYFNVISQLNAPQLKRFSKELFPLYKAKLALMQRQNQDTGQAEAYDSESMIAFRANIHELGHALGTDDKTTDELFEEEHTKLSTDVAKLFQERFGITKMPKEFTSEDMRSIKDFSLYLANLNNRNDHLENVLGFYLALKINGQWEALRRGEQIDPTLYLQPEKSGEIVQLMQKRQEFSPLTPDNLEIREEDMPEFLQLLQQETHNMMIGDIETIDVKLATIIANLKTTTDLDLYPDPLDKKRMALLLQWGNKKVGSVAARMYQQTNQPERVVTFTEEDESIRRQIVGIIEESDGLDANDPQVYKEHFQDGLRPLATVVNLQDFISKTGAEKEIEIFRERLKVDEDVVSIFQRLGEDFHETSGAQPLNQDLTYLEGLIEKRQTDLLDQEREKATAYTTAIREQMGKIEDIYGKIVDKFTAMRHGSQETKNNLLDAKFADIERVLSLQDSKEAITSTMTGDMNMIIENMRECLSCVNQGENNDTNVTFGDANKFYVYSQTEKQSDGSIADQIVFLEPITNADGTQEMAFVFDRIYGSSTQTVLQNHVETVLRTVKRLTTRFPALKLSVFVTDAALKTGGSSAEAFAKLFDNEELTTKQENIKVDIAPSAFGDHYIEFGSEGVKTSGMRTVNGVSVTV